jgi:protein-L-isoaspartate O-methyltransferase
MTTHRGMIRMLTEKGALPPDWRDTVASVDRALFVPTVFEGCDFGADPEGWLRNVYADAPVVTQVNDGLPLSSRELRQPTASSSMPSLMLEMLGILHVQEGHRVLEIGTGTGYNAAWLSHRLGDENVTTVEIDAGVLTSARENLRQAGYRPVTVLGNGRDGYRPNAPYDRILSTCTMRDVPHSWLRQCPQGRIVTPWGSSFYCGSFATLDVLDGEALGVFSGCPGPMWDRTQRPDAARPADIHRGEQGLKGSTRIPPPNVIQDDPAFFAGLHLTDVRYRWCEAEDDSGEAALWLFADDRKSWATVEYAPALHSYETEQYGPRALWDELVAVFMAWHELGRPERSRYGITADAEGQRIWLDTPDRVITRR